MKRPGIVITVLLLCTLTLGCGLLSAVMQSDTGIGHALRVGAKTWDGFRRIPYKEELEYGRALAVQAFHYYGLLRCPEAEKYLNLVVNTVGVYSDRPSINYYMVITNEDELNAMAAPGGYVFITWRMLLTLQDESELAGVIGHEIGHICEKHALKTMQNVKRKEALVELASGGDQGAFNSLIDGIAGGLFGAPASRRQEVNCDRLGSVYIAKAGYDNEGLARALGRFKAAGCDAKGRHYGKLDDRIAEALKYQKKKGYGGGGGRKLAERYQKRCLEPLKAALKAQGIKF